MLRKQHKPSKSRSRRQSLGRQRQSTAPSLKGMPTSDSTAPELRPIHCITLIMTVRSYFLQPLPLLYNQHNVKETTQAV